MSLLWQRRNRSSLCNYWVRPGGKLAAQEGFDLARLRVEKLRQDLRVVTLPGQPWFQRGYPCIGERLLKASSIVVLPYLTIATQGDEFSCFDLEFQFADDLLGMFRLKIPSLPEVPSKAVVIPDVTQPGDSLSVRRPKYSSTWSMTSFLLGVVSKRVNPIELFRRQLSKRNGQVIGYSRANHIQPINLR